MMSRTINRSAAGIFPVLALFSSCLLQASDVDEFKVKRQEVFEFATKPTVTRDASGQSDRFAIRFASKAHCDVTLVIEAADGRIIRHLASGVLGPNAPEPLQKGSLEQAVVWDGKNDQGVYVKEPERCTVRVSLGLKPAFERVLFWSPKKRVTSKAIIVPTAEGVYVFEGSGADHLRLFSHAGDYVRTIYPFPPDKIRDVKGLTWKSFPGGGEFPLKPSFYQQTFLTSGESGCPRWVGSMTGYAASAMAVHQDRIALACIRLNRLATDGTTGGLALEGPITSLPLGRIDPGRDAYDAPKSGGSTAHVAPRSAAFSPDGKWLYLTRYTWKSTSYRAAREWVHGVYRVPFDGEGDLKLFAGSGKRGRDLKPEEAELLKVPAAVACDAAGRVYVADHENDRVQVFSPDGRVLKSIPVTKPAALGIHHKTQELYVFSWQLMSRFTAFGEGHRVLAPKPAWTRFGPFDNPRVIQTGDLPLVGAYRPYNQWGGGLEFAVALDSWADPEGPPVIWMVSYAHDQGVSLLEWTSGYSAAMFRKQARWERSGIRLYGVEKDGRLKLRRDFGQEVVKKVVRPSWPGYREVQRLYVNPATGLLYVGEGEVGTLGKSFQSLVEINPATGKIRIVDLPFGAEDMAFDMRGLAYLRQTDVIARYTFPGFREVPWDYGEELENVGIWGGRFAKVTSALVIPSRSPVCFHQGGLSVSPNGNLVVASSYRVTDRKRDIDRWESARQVFVSRPYVPPRYPGREESPTSACAHVWDRHGKLLYEDAIPGMPQVDGIAIDADNDLYIMATPARIVDGKPFFNRFSSTLIKFQPNRGKFISSTAAAPVLLPPEDAPKRPGDLYRGGHTYWVEGARWFFGGVGYASFNANWAPSCACWHARFTLDYFGRSFAPEPLRFSVAVVDKAGNLILHIGRYGNEDSAGQGSRSPVGGDEVGLMHPAFVAVHTDNRLFIQDYGNARIVSVKLDYHATERVAVPPQGPRRPPAGPTGP
jgi:sugar lactone lactonase YvrE